MSAVPLHGSGAGRRSRVLRAVGITAWRLRPGFLREADAQGAGDLPAGPAAVIASACAVVLPAGCEPRALDLLGRALSAYGAGLARAGRVQVADGKLVGDVPQVPAYLVFGQAQAHALGRELPASTMRQAQIVLVDPPAQILAEAASKRRLWSGLRQLRRALAASAVE